MHDEFRTIIEPFRIHSVEPVAMTTREERVEELERAATTSSTSRRREC